MPIFNAGRTRAINEIAESGQNEAVLRYEDGSCALSRTSRTRWSTLRDEHQRSEDLETAARSAEAALGRARSLYDRGQIDLLPLLDAQRARLAVSVSANDSRTQLLIDSVQLYKALGGGWQAFEPAAQPASAATTPTPKS
jgi:outer membrane protein TolC